MYRQGDTALKMKKGRPGRSNNMALSGKAGETFSEINVTPLTDVFLVLLVIMILIAPLANQAALKIKTPTSGVPHTQAQKKSINAFVSETGTVTINNQKVDPPNTVEIMAAIKAIQEKYDKKNLPLILSSDANATQKNIVSVMDAASGCKIESMTILAPKTSSDKI